MRTAHAGQTRVSLPALRTARAQMAAAGSLASAAAAHRVPGSPNAAFCRESKAPCKRGQRGRKCRPWPASAWLLGAIAADDGAEAAGAVANALSFLSPCSFVGSVRIPAVLLLNACISAHSLASSPRSVAISAVSLSYLACITALSARNASKFVRIVQQPHNDPSTPAGEMLIGACICCSVSSCCHLWYTSKSALNEISLVSFHYSRVMALILCS